MSGAFQAGWQVFVPPMSPRHSKYQQYQDIAVLAVNKRGEILFSRGAWELLGKPEYVQCLMNDKGKIGFRPCERDTVGSYHFQTKGAKYVIRLTAKSFSREANIPHDNSLYKLEKEGDMLVCNLRQPPVE